MDRNYTCPVLGDYLHREAQSVVLMDNDSTNMSDEIEEAIQDAGAVLVYSPPYSLHLNPIENFFVCIKNVAKRVTHDGARCPWYALRAPARGQWRFWEMVLPFGRR